MFVWLFLPETLPPQRRQTQLDWGHLLRQWGSIACHPTFRAHALLTSSTTGACSSTSPCHRLPSSTSCSAPRLSMAHWHGHAVAVVSDRHILCRRWLPAHGLIGTGGPGGVASRWPAVCTWPPSRFTASCSICQPPGPAPACGSCLRAWHSSTLRANRRGVGLSPASGRCLSPVGLCVGVGGICRGAGAVATHQPAALAHSIHPMNLGMTLGGMSTAWVAFTLVRKHGLPPQAAD